MSDMKCPFCGEKLQQTYSFNPKQFWCSNYYDHKHPINMQGTKELWQELIRTRKALEQSEICCTEWEKQALDYKAENIALSGDLERTRKALDVAVDALKEYANEEHWDFEHFYSLYTYDKAKEALEQITALEQKDK